MNVLGIIFLNYRKDRHKEWFFFVKCRRAYVLKNITICVFATYLFVHVEIEISIEFVILIH